MNIKPSNTSFQGIKFDKKFLNMATANLTTFEQQRQLKGLAVFKNQLESKYPNHDILISTGSIPSNRKIYGVVLQEHVAQVKITDKTSKKLFNKPKVTENSFSFGVTPLSSGKNHQGKPLHLESIKKSLEATIQSGMGKLSQLANQDVHLNIEQKIKQLKKDLMK